MIRRTPPVRFATRQDAAEPRERADHRPAQFEQLASPPETAPRRQPTLKRLLRLVWSPAARPEHARFAQVTVEPRWYPRDLAVGSTAAWAAAEPDPPPPAVVPAVAADRFWGVVTMVAAAGLAATVSVVVAPQLRGAAPPVIAENSTLLAQGAAVYGTACAGCHGADLKGDGAFAQGLRPPPLDGSGHAWLHSDATLFRMVKFGVANCLSADDRPRMPSFGRQLDDRSIQAVIAFVKSRWSSNLRMVQNAFNDGASDDAETQEAVLCTAICAPTAPTDPVPNLAVR